MKRPKFGDVIEIDTGQGFAYGHYSHKERFYQSLLRVYNRLYAERPENLAAAVAGEPDFFQFTFLGSYVHRGIMRIAGHVPLSEEARRWPLFRGENGHDLLTNRVEQWWTWDAEKNLWARAEIDDVRSLSPHGVCDDVYLIEMILERYSPETDWRLQPLSPERLEERRAQTFGYRRYRRAQNHLRNETFSLLFADGRPIFADVVEVMNDFPLVLPQPDHAEIVVAEGPTGAFIVWKIAEEPAPPKRGRKKKVATDLPARIEPNELTIESSSNRLAMKVIRRLADRWGFLIETRRGENYLSSAFAARYDSNPDWDWGAYVEPTDGVPTPLIRNWLVSDDSV